MKNLAPLKVNGIKAVWFGTVCWGLSLLILIVQKSELEKYNKEHWIWIASSGLILGFLGIRYTTNRVKRLDLNQSPDQSELIQDFE